MTATNSVVEPIEKGWRQLDALVESLGPHGLTIRGADGWAVKDHLAHIAAWEHSLIGLLDGRNRLEAMGVPGASDETDAINAAVWSLHRDKSPDEVLAYSRQTHALLIQVLSSLSDADLQLPYNHFQPHDPRDPDDNRPVVDWVAGDTYEHYAEHIDSMNQLVNSSAAR